MGYEKFVLDADQLGMWHAFCKGVDLSDSGQALDAFLTNEPGTHFLGHPHTLANFETAFYRSPVADNSSFEQWELEGANDAAQRANSMWKRALGEYEQPSARRGRRGRAGRVDRAAEGVVPGLERMTRPSRVAPCVAALRGAPVRRRRRGGARARAARHHADGHGVAAKGDRAHARRRRASQAAMGTRSSRTSRRDSCAIADT